MRILLVEDDDALRYTLRRALEMEGHEAEVAACANEAIAIATRRHVHLIVTDYNLGSGMNGLLLVSHLKENSFEVPTILMSGCREAWLEDAARELGVSAFLEKPFPIDELLDACSHALQECPTTQKRKGRMRTCEIKSYLQCS